MIPSCALFVSQSSGPHIHLSNQSISDISSASPEADYTIGNDGGVSSNAGALENWISDSSFAANYKTVWQLISGTAPNETSGGDLRRSSRWELRNFNSGTTTSCVIQVSIKEKATGDIKATATITMSATVR